MSGSGDRAREGKKRGERGCDGSRRGREERVRQTEERLSGEWKGNERQEETK